MDDSAPLMHVDWIRWLELLKRAVETPVDASLIVGGQPLTRVDDTNVTITLGGTPATALLKAVSLTLGWTGTLAAARLNANVVQAVTNDTNVTGAIAAQVLTLGWTGTLAVTRGGTGLATVTTGDLLYGSAANTLSRRAIGSTGDVLTVTGGLPVWAATSGLGTGDLTRVNDTNVTLTLGGTPVDSLFKDVSLALGWTGTLGLARGGTNANLSATGGTAQYLKQASSGAAITVGTIPASDIASGAALTKTDDTNVTLTLGGSPTVALLVATSLTLGWTGTLGVTRGGTGASTFTLGSVVFAGASGVYTQDNANFFYNVSNGRLGMGTTSPNSLIHIKSTSGFPILNIESTTVNGGLIQLTSSTNNWQMYASSGNFRWDVNVTAPTGTKMILTNNGLLQLGTTAAIATATSALFIADGTAPTGAVMPANTAAIYVDNPGTSGLFAMDDAGVASRLTGAAYFTTSLGIGVTSATAWLHIKAGTATASTAPLKFTSGTNLTTAEAGAMEYNGTNLFFTRAGTVRENVMVAVDNAAAPTTSIGVGIVNYYGSAATNFLGDPNRWLSVNILGVVYKIPLYT